MGLVVAGIDPGGTTGYCLIDAPLKLLSCGEGENRAKVLAWVMLNKPDIIVIEEFKLYPGMGKMMGWREMTASKVISAVEDLCSREGIKLVKQSASLKDRITDRILKTGGLYQRAHPHANDAIRHALFYLWFKEGMVNEKEVTELLKKASDELPANKERENTEYLKELRKLAVMSSLFYEDYKKPDEIPVSEMVYINLLPEQKIYHLYKDCAGLSNKYMPVLKKWLGGRWLLCTDCKAREEAENIAKKLAEGGD